MKRYDFCGDYMDDSPDGQYILHSDHLQEVARAKVEAVKELMEFVSHQSWRCHSDYYPNECKCGLDITLQQLTTETTTTNEGRG